MIDESYRCLLGLPTRPLDDEEMRIFIVLSMVDNSQVKAAEAWKEATYKLGSAKIFDRRMAVWGVDFDPTLALFLVSCCRAPGQIVMWCYTTGLMGLELGHPASINDWTMAYFPHGLPTDEAYGLAWEAQKGTTEDAENGRVPPLGNWLDDVGLVRRLLHCQEQL